MDTGNNHDAGKEDITWTGNGELANLWIILVMMFRPPRVTKIRASRVLGTHPLHQSMQGQVFIPRPTFQCPRSSAD